MPHRHVTTRTSHQTWVSKFLGFLPNNKVHRWAYYKYYLWAVAHSFPPRTSPPLPPATNRFNGLAPNLKSSQTLTFVPRAASVVNYERLSMTTTTSSRPPGVSTCSYVDRYRLVWQRSNNNGVKRLERTSIVWHLLVCLMVCWFDFIAIFNEAE